MSLTFYQDDNAGGYEYYAVGNIYDFSDRTMSWYSSWNDEVSSLYTSTSIYVFEDAGYSGDGAILSAGFHDLDSLESYGIENDSISSFYTLYQTLPA